MGQAVKEVSAQQEVRSRLRGPNWAETKAGPTDLYAWHIILEEDSRKRWAGAYQISARTEGGRPDWRKNFLACSPEDTQQTTQRDGHLILLNYLWHVGDPHKQVFGLFVMPAPYPRRSRGRGRGCRTACHVSPSPLEWWPIHWLRLDRTQRHKPMTFEVSLKMTMKQDFDSIVPPEVKVNPVPTRFICNNRIEVGSHAGGGPSW